MMETNDQDEDDEMLREYDLSKLNLVGRGIYSEQYRAGVKFIICDDGDRVNENNKKDEQNVDGPQ
jgi:hypothetical protein